MLCFYFGILHDPLRCWAGVRRNPQSCKIVCRVWGNKNPSSSCEPWFLLGLVRLRVNPSGLKGFEGDLNLLTEQSLNEIGEGGLSFDQEKEMH